MAIWPFNRKKNQSVDLPQEVQDYYQAEKRERVGVAGLLALGTLLVTIVLAIGLFFGGRWVYRTVFDNDDNQVAQEDNNDEADEASTTNDSETEPHEHEDGEEHAEDEDEAETPAPAPAPTPTPAPTPEPSPTATPNTAANDLPDTGPGSTATLFVATVVIAGGAHYAFSRQKISKR